MVLFAFMCLSTCVYLDRAQNHIVGSKGLNV